MLVSVLEKANEGHSVTVVIHTLKYAQDLMKRVSIMFTQEGLPHVVLYAAYCVHMSGGDVMVHFVTPAQLGRFRREHTPRFEFVDNAVSDLGHHIPADHRPYDRRVGTFSRRECDQTALAGIDKVIADLTALIAGWSDK